MKIAIDALPLMMTRTGVGFYTEHLLTQFFKIAPENDYYLCDILWGKRLYNLFAVGKGSWNTIDALRNISKIPPALRKFARIGLTFKRVGRVGKMDLFFGPNFRGLFREDLKTVITIHDMAHEYYPEAAGPEILQFLKRELPANARKASLIIADSQNTKKDILTFLDIPDAKVKVIYGGVDETFRLIRDPIILESVRNKYNLPEKFILYVGAIQPRKNIEGLIQAYAKLSRELNSKYHLVIAGGVGWKNDNLRRLINELRLRDKITFPGYIASPDLPILYNLAEVFVFPSFYEGFGLPVIEAMACGIPVVTSNVSSLPEVAGEGAIYVNPHSVEELADGMRKMLSDEDLRKTYIRKGVERARSFTWERCAIETLKVFNEAYHLPATGLSPAKPNV